MMKDGCKTSTCEHLLSKTRTRMLTLSANALTIPAPLPRGWWAEGWRFAGTKEKEEEEEETKKRRNMDWSAVLCGTKSSCTAASNSQCCTWEQHLDSACWRWRHKYDNADSGGLRRRRAGHFLLPPASPQINSASKFSAICHGPVCRSWSEIRCQC